MYKSNSNNSLSDHRSMSWNFPLHFYPSSSFIDFTRCSCIGCGIGGNRTVNFTVGTGHTNQTPRRNSHDGGIDGKRSVHVSVGTEQTNQTPGGIVMVVVV